MNYFESGLKIYISFPFETMISWALGSEKLPETD